jgi:hypothetical protein
MPSKTRWALNPRKWFGTISLNNTHKHEKNQNLLTRAPSTAATTTRTFPCLSTTKTRQKRISNDAIQISATITQLQLPAFSVRREKTSTVLPSATTTVNRQTTFFPTHTEPTIRKNGRVEEELSIDTTRWNIQQTTSTIYGRLKYENPTVKQMNADVSNISNRCLINYPIHTSNILEESSFPTRSSSPSIVDDSDNSSSSGIYTDERQLTESKQTISTLEVLSVESIADSQASLNHSHTRPIIHHYRRPVSVFPANDDKPQQRQTSVIRSHRSHSADGILNDSQIISTPKSRQSSVDILKQTDTHSPIITLEKAGLVRIANDTYRLTNDNLNHLSYRRKNSINSFVPYSDYDDSLRSAKDEECYATLPRTSSTEQLNDHIQNDLRIVVDECIRPIVHSIGKNRLTKNHRYKRSHQQLNIDELTDKLLSSIDCSIYTRYQRCF